MKVQCFLLSVALAVVAGADVRKDNEQSCNGMTVDFGHLEKKIQPVCLEGDVQISQLTRHLQKKGFSFSLKLFYNDELLNESLTIADYKIDGQTPIQVREDQQFRFWVRRLSLDEEEWLGANENTTVGDVKEQLKETNSYPIYIPATGKEQCEFLQQLYFRGVLLDDDQKKLVKLQGMKEGAKMLLLLKVCGHIF
ncbi:hypothetical protein M3Y99_00657700 [Aphelenchoides fujianensis]|nr:hypothetical protein M3Y99_00657700 [Aphelenchoides fujianensis]